MIKIGQDFLAGLLFLAVGIFIFVTGRDLPLGSASSMRQGYFPRLLAWALCIVGGIISIKGLAIPGAPTPRFAFHSFLPVVAVVVFGLLLQPTGMAIAITALVFISSLGPDFRLLSAVGLSLFLILFIWLVFILGLGLPLQLWPSL
ncbi:MAG: tripartite tricarboxylate transporter TctB family protein [Deltaproteobacteria bacterium]